MGPFIIIGIVAVLLVILIANIQIVPQARAYVVERLGAYNATWHTGIHWKIPFIERVAKKVSLMEQVADFQPQAVITKDNVKMQIDTVVFYQITDCKLFTYGVEAPLAAIENLTATTLRNIIGDLELDETLQLTATVKPANATIQDIIWTSSNSGVASVDENGLVTALYKGTATITATSSEGGKTAECVVTVNGLSEETQWEVSSPDGNVTMNLWLDDAGKLHYSAVKGEAAIAEDSHIGMVSDLADFTSGLLFVESSELEKVDYEYEMVSGKNSLVRNLYNTVSLTFRKGPAKFIVELRL